MTSRSSGFSLIELLVVVAIVGVLSAIATMTYSGYVSASKKKSTEGIMQLVALAQLEYYSENNDYHFSDSCGVPNATSSMEINQELFDHSEDTPNLVIPIKTDDTGQQSSELGWFICIASANSGASFILRASKGDCTLILPINSTIRSEPDDC